ncbi:unnamed protein product, partial [Mesorhabditis spiculigera]
MVGATGERAGYGARTHYRQPLPVNGRCGRVLLGHGPGPQYLATRAPSAVYFFLRAVSHVPAASISSTDPTNQKHFPLHTMAALRRLRASLARMFSSSPSNSARLSPSRIFFRRSKVDSYSSLAQTPDSSRSVSFADSITWPYIDDDENSSISR